MRSAKSNFKNNYLLLGFNFKRDFAVGQRKHFHPYNPTQWSVKNLTQTNHILILQLNYVFCVKQWQVLYIIGWEWNINSLFCQAPTQLPTPSPLQPNLISTQSQSNSSKSWVGVIPYNWFVPPPTHQYSFLTLNPMYRHSLFNLDTSRRGN